MKTESIFMYIGGPTVMIEWGGARFLTDPTFDPAGSQSTTGPVLSANRGLLRNHQP